MYGSLTCYHRIMYLLLYTTILSCEFEARELLIECVNGWYGVEHPYGIND